SPSGDHMCVVPTGNLWVQGMCSFDCTLASCPTSASGCSSVVFSGSAPNHGCLPKCTYDKGATSGGCRAAYVCELGLMDGNPSYETLLAIARALEVPMADLFRDGPSFESPEPSHARLVDFARKAHLSKPQVERLVAVGYAMFGLEPENRASADRPVLCSVDGC